MSKKNIIFMTCLDGAPDVLDYKEWCYKSWKTWCDKNNAEMIILDEELRDKTIMKPTWQRWHVFEILKNSGIEYNQVALVDIDTMIHPNAPNFFDETNGEYAGVNDDLMVEWVHNSISGYQDMFPDVKFDWTTYMNNGFIVMSPKHKKLCKTITDFYYKNEDELRTRQHETLKKGSDQTPVNYLVRQEKYPITHLSKKWNFTHMHVRGVLQNALFLDCAWIYHFNGFEKTLRNNLMKQTWEEMKRRYNLED
tara:strand:+ start:299 stop:1051 length:753 start_codon:yes stop_codon:yes gene_type:complete